MSIQYDVDDDEMLWKEPKKKKKIYRKRRKMLYGVELPKEVIDDYKENRLLEDE